MVANIKRKTLEYWGNSCKIGNVCKKLGCIVRNPPFVTLVQCIIKVAYPKLHE